MTLEYRLMHVDELGIRQFQGSCFEPLTRVESDDMLRHAINAEGNPAIGSCRLEVEGFGCSIKSKVRLEDTD